MRGVAVPGAREKYAEVRVSLFDRGR